MTLKSYMAGRRLCHATLSIRDTNERILDIAIRFGYSSQEALTRAFTAAYGCTPYAYRKHPRPVLLPVKQNVYFPQHYIPKGETTVAKTILTEPNVRVEYIPQHQFIGIWDSNSSSYFDFMGKHDCDEITGIIDSMSHVAHPVVTCHTAGWFFDQGNKGYLYGLGVVDDYTGEVPAGFEIRTIPASYYLVFYHPPFDYMQHCEEVMNRVESLAWGFDPLTRGCKWNEQVRQVYQRHAPETLGYEVLRPVSRLK
jgi:AraC family transcriptional regulator